MNDAQFVDACKSTESLPEKIVIEGDQLRTLHAAEGLVTEASEILDAFKKHHFYGKELDTVNLIEELGDLEWYMAIMRDALGVTTNQVREIVIKKLKARYPQGFSQQKAVDRNLEAERNILESEL